MRTIRIHCKLPAVDYTKAIAYLTTWAMDSYTEVDIYEDGGNDLVACYSCETDRKYIIGAVWRKESGEYTFHS